MIWRYLDFPKFIAMLEHQGLFFPRLDLLGDPFEGAWPTKSLKPLRELIDAVSPIVREQVAPRFRENFDLGFAEEGRRLVVRLIRQYANVSCWYDSEVESAAMWGLYSKGSGGVAIGSTEEKLRRLFPTIRVERVKYVDFSKDNLPIPSPGDNPLQAVADVLINRCFYKRNAFRYEQELRAAFFNTPIVPQNKFEPMHRLSEPGRWLECRLQDLIDCVLVAPGSQPWLVELVKSALQSKGFEVRVKQSSLDSEPVFY